jgi:hypothetical protein|tara:strand:+ start:502 stop:696 length:195 start_codon:yes stop_codon:yes gene_type:complete
MPPKQSFFRVAGVLITNQDSLEHNFSIFMKAIDDNHAVILVREHLKNNAPLGRSIVKEIEKLTA